jgi:hypothetical protein
MTASYSSRCEDGSARVLHVEWTGGQCRDRWKQAGRREDEGHDSAGEYDRRPRAAFPPCHDEHVRQANRREERRPPGHRKPRSDSQRGLHGFVPSAAPEAEPAVSRLSTRLIPGADHAARSASWRSCHDDTSPERHGDSFRREQRKWCSTRPPAPDGRTRYLGRRFDGRPPDSRWRSAITRRDRRTVHV